ncbi:acyltransferase [Propionibacteriaceae bacterium G57]|uniref:acyltransferase n=1 Tax=Aestuariimicrobium sp. G57 TaxID=3418485 RepID=UPI003DA6F38E
MPTPQRLLYPDLLRVIAMLAVVALHVAGYELLDVRVGSRDMHWMNILDGATRWCVPIYVMVSGMFLLRPSAAADDLRAAYRKTLRGALRLLSILVIWSVLYGIFTMVLGNQPVTVASTAQWLVEMWFNPTWYHLWFLYMLVPLYFLSPLVRLFLHRTEPRHADWLVLVLVVGGPVTTFVLTLLGALTGQGLYRMMPEYTGYLCYFVLGWWLAHREHSARQRLGIHVAGLAGIAFTIIATAMASTAQGKFTTAFYAYPLVTTAATAAAVFVAAKQWGGAHEPSAGQRQVITALGAATLGIYLVHPALLAIVMRGFRAAGWTMANGPLPTPVLLVLVTVVVFAGSLLFALVVRAVLQRLPRGRDWVGWVI